MLHPVILTKRQGSDKSPLSRSGLPVASTDSPRSINHGSGPNPYSKIRRLPCPGGNAVSISHGARIARGTEIAVCAQVHIMDAETVSLRVESVEVLGCRRRQTVARSCLRAVVGENAESG